MAAEEKVDKNVIEGLIEGRIHLDSENVNILNWVKEDVFYDIIEAQLDYLDVITDVSLIQFTDCEPSFYNLLKNNNVFVTADSPLIVKGCSQYILEKYVNDEIDNDVLFACFPYFFDPFFEHKALVEYLKKGFDDLSKFYKAKVDYDTMKFSGFFTPMFKANICKLSDGSGYEIVGDSVNAAAMMLALLKKIGKTSMIKRIHIKCNTEPSGRSLINILNAADENNIQVISDGPFSFVGTYSQCLEFMVVCNCGSVELIPFDKDSFMRLLATIQTSTFCNSNFSMSVNVKMSDLMDNESFFLNLNTDVPINFYSSINFKFKDEQDVDFFDTSHFSLQNTFIPLEGAYGIKALDSFLDNMVRDIRESNLSPLERAYAVYQIVKEYRYLYYSGRSINSMASDESRNKYLVALNHYIVCAGYCNVYVDLLKRVGIESCYWSIKSKNPNDAGHARVLVNIYDPKYLVSGYFMCDPTWDSSSKDDELQICRNNYFCRSILQTHEYSENSDDYYLAGDNPDLFGDDFLRDPEKYVSSWERFDKLIGIIRKFDSKLYDVIEESDDVNKAKRIIIDRIKGKTSENISQNTFTKVMYRVSEFFGDGDIRSRIWYHPTPVKARKSA